MAVSNFTVKMSGTVAYTDNSHGSFESSASWQGHIGGVVATHSSADSEANFSQLVADKSAELTSMFNVLGGTVTLSPPAATPDKTVSSFVMEVSGEVSYDDGTPTGVFLAQWVNGVVDVFPSDSATHWAAISGAGTTAASFLDQVFETLAGGSGALVLDADDLATATATMFNVVSGPDLPVSSDVGSNYFVGDEITLTGGTFTEAAVLTVAKLSTIAGQDETNFGGGEFIGTFSGGSGYDAADTITLSDGTVVTVDAVATAGDVVMFTVTSATAPKSAGFGNAATLTQSSTSGSGVGFTLSPQRTNQGVATASHKQVAEVVIGEYTVLPANPVAQGSSTGAGTGATFTLDWGVKNVTVVVPGDGYAVAPAVTFGGAGGSGTTATATVSGGDVTGITVTAAGSGYTERATVTIAPPV